MADRENGNAWDVAPLPFQSLSLGGRILEVNTQWEELTGYSGAEFIGRPYWNLVPADYLQQAQENFAQLTSSGVLDGVNCVVQRKDGGLRNVRVYGRLNEGAGTTECMLVDVTGQWKTEQDLKESEERFRNLFELEPTPILIHDGVETVIANQACAKFLGYESCEEMTGLSVADLVHSDDRPKVAERVARMMTEDWTAPATTEHLMRRDGTVVCAEVFASPVVFNGKRVIHVVALDLSERIEADRALSESESRYRTLFEHSAHAIVVSDGRAVRFANRKAIALFGLPEGHDGAGVALTDFIHPNSLELANERIASLLGGAQHDKPSELELIRTDGSHWYAEATSVTLPINGEVLVQTMLRDLTESRRTEEELEGYRAKLEELLAERTERLERVQQQLNAVTTVVSRTVEMRDPYTAGHQRRVAALAVAVANKLEMDPEDVGHLEVAAHLHDVGKVSVPAEILSRPSRLTALEFELVKTHVEAGYSIVSSADLPEPVAEIVYQHHERLDGSGYPRGLKAQELLMGSQVLMVADVVEAMCTHRPYRPAFGIDAALEAITAGSGTLYDAEVVEACRAVVREGFVFVDQF